MKFRVSLMDWCYYEALVEAEDLSQAEERAINQYDDRKLTPYDWDIRTVHIVATE